MMIEANNLCSIHHSLVILLQVYKFLSKQDTVREVILLFQFIVTDKKTDI